GGEGDLPGRRESPVHGDRSCPCSRRPKRARSPRRPRSRSRRPKRARSPRQAPLHDDGPPPKFTATARYDDVQAPYGLAPTISTVMVLPLGASYEAVSPTFLPLMAEPSGDCSE